MKLSNTVRCDRLRFAAKNQLTLNIMNRSVQCELRPDSMQRAIELIGSLRDNGNMGRPKNFSREGVLEKTIPVLWKHGFADASLQDLERAAGAIKSGLYAEFKGKEDLILASSRHYFAPAVEKEIFRSFNDDLGGELRLLADFDQQLLFADAAILGHVTSGPAHEPLDQPKKRT
jgi:hypothetical protein